MKFGLIYSFRNPPESGRSFPDLYRETFEQIRYADDLGFDEIWITEHHFIEDGYTPSVLPMAAAVAVHTTRARIGTWVLLLPLHNALRVAEDAAAVDLISNGRFDLGLGLGYRIEEFEGFGVPRTHRRSLMEEGLEIIRRAWTEESFSFEGKHYHLKNVKLRPKPAQKPHPPIWLAARGDKAAERAARFKAPLMLVGRREVYDRYAAVLREQGEDPVNYEVLTRFHWLVSEDPERTWHSIAKHVNYLFSSYAKWYGEAADLKDDRLWTTQLREEANKSLVMTPDDCVAAIENYLNTMPTTHLVSFATIPGVSLDVSTRSLELFADKVRPRLETTN